MAPLDCVAFELDAVDLINAHQDDVMDQEVRNDQKGGKDDNVQESAFVVREVNVRVVDGEGEGVQADEGRGEVLKGFLSALPVPVQMCVKHDTKAGVYYYHKKL